jgi:hypothetical protein
VVWVLPQVVPPSPALLHHQTLSQFSVLFPSGISFLLHAEMLRNKSFTFWKNSNAAVDYIEHYLLKF